MYYPADNVKWIGKHLEADAAIWWRVVRDQIKNFEEFKEIFTQKYWGPEKQDDVRTVSYTHLDVYKRQHASNVN